MSNHELDKIKESQQELITSVRNLETALELSQAELKAEMDEGFKGLELLLTNVLGEFRQLNKDVQDLKDKI